MNRSFYRHFVWMVISLPPLQALQLSPHSLSDCVATIYDHNNQQLFKKYLTGPIEKKIDPDLFPLTIELHDLFKGQKSYFMLFNNPAAYATSKVAATQKLFIAHPQGRLFIENHSITISYPDNLYFDWLSKCALLPFSAEAKTDVSKQLKKLEHMADDADASSITEYLDWVTSIPWGKQSTHNIDLAEAHKELNAEHYGLESVKQNILLYLSSLTPIESATITTAVAKSPVLCLVGPPGVGKTTIAESIAKALKRPFYKISLNGEGDPSLLKGHQRAYKNSSPGKLIQALCKTGCMNPVILLDEIDKVAPHNEGSRLAHGLLDILDPEQHKTFKDHYLSSAIDLSQVIFIATANDFSLIPQPLQDRFEVIEIMPYTLKQKILITQQHLLPKALLDLNLTPSALALSDETIKKIIQNHSANGSLRSIEKNIVKLCRLYHRSLRETKTDPTVKPLELSPETLSIFLTPLPAIRTLTSSAASIGTITSIAMTKSGPAVVEIVASNMGQGNSYVGFANDCTQLFNYAQNLLPNILKMKELHNPSCYTHRQKRTATVTNNISIHIGHSSEIIAEDAPSLGLPLAIATFSALAFHNIALKYVVCGGIDGLQRIIKVSHIKERIIAAELAGFNSMIVSIQNKAEVEPLLPFIESLNIFFATTMDQVIALMGPCCQP